MRFKSFFSIILALIIIFGFALPAGALSAPTGIVSEAYCIADAATGQILVEGNSNKHMEPASITKILTCALALERLNPDTVYTFSKSAAAYDKTGTHLAFVEGETCTVRDLLYGAMVESANDCAMGLADAVSGSQMDFVKLMNEKLGELGCDNSHFANATGMPDSNHYTTAADMVKITKYALSVLDFETYFNAWDWTIPATNKNSERKFGTHHSMIVGSENNSSYGYDGATGGKLGWTEEALHTIVTVAERNGMRLICVCLKSQNKYAKYKDSIALFDYCFENFAYSEIPVAVPKTDIPITENGSSYGKMKVYPMASVKVLLTDGLDSSCLSAKANIPETVDISEISSVAVSVTIDASTSAMYTGTFSVAPEYTVIRDSELLENEAEFQKDKGVFRWWLFFVIPIGIILFLGLVVLAIRTYNIKKYKKLRRHRHYQRLGRN